MVVIGAGGHAGVVIEAARAAGLYDPVALLDVDPSSHGGALAGVPIRGGDELLAELAAEGVKHFITGMGGVKDNSIRAAAFRTAVSAGLVPATVVHPRAWVALSAVIGSGTLVAAGSMVGVSARIGQNCIVNTGAVVEHDCVVGDHVHLASRSCLCGSVVVGELSHVGAGATVRQGTRLSAGVVVGCGAAVVHDVPEGSCVVGVPAAQLGGEATE